MENDIWRIDCVGCCWSRESCWRRVCLFCVGRRGMVEEDVQLLWVAWAEEMVAVAVL